MLSVLSEVLRNQHDEKWGGGRSHSLAVISEIFVHGRSASELNPERNHWREVNWEVKSILLVFCYWFLNGFSSWKSGKYLLCFKLLGAEAVCRAAGVWYAMPWSVSDSEPQPATAKAMPKDERIETFPRLGSVSILCTLFLTCTFLLFQAFSAARKNEKKKNHFPPANDYIKHFSAVMLGEESGIIRKTCKEDHQFAVPTCSQWESDALDTVLPGPAWYTEQPRCLQS